MSSCPSTSTRAHASTRRSSGSSSDRKRDAVAADAEIRRLRRLGRLDLVEAGRQTLADHAADWFRDYARINLSPSTQADYACLWDAHNLERLGGLELRRLTPQVVEGFRAELERAGVGPASVRKTMVILQGVLQRAVVWQKIPTNPVRAVAKPRERRQLNPRPLAPASVEALRARLGRRDATLISLLAYAGLRPGEALALRWGDVGKQTITVTKAISVGGEKATKTGRGEASARLAPLASDLAAWRLASGRPDDATPVFPRKGRNAPRGTRTGGTGAAESFTRPPRKPIFARCAVRPPSRIREPAIA